MRHGQHGGGKRCGRRLASRALGITCVLCGAGGVGYAMAPTPPAPAATALSPFNVFWILHAMLELPLGLQAFIVPLSLPLHGMTLATIMVARVRTLTALTLAVWGLSHSIERCVSARVWAARLSSRKACLCCADAFFPRDRVGRVLANGLALARSQAARVCRRMDPSGAGAVPRRDCSDTCGGRYSCDTLVRRSPALAY